MEALCLVAIPMVWSEFGLLDVIRLSFLVFSDANLFLSFGTKLVTALL